MNNSPKIFVLSPHIDDAAFGLALTISKLASKNIPVTIINCFTVTKWTAIPVENKEIAAVSRLRKEEDVEFYKRLNPNIKIINLDLLDAPLRNGYIFQNQPFQDNELELIGELRKLIGQYVDGELLLCPMAIGDHIDHAICREAVIELYKRQKIVFFEDLPYAQRIGEDQILRHKHHLEEQVAAKFKNCICGSENAFIDKGKAIRIYKSQLNEEICSEITSHMNAIGGERIWGEDDLIELLKSIVEN